ncbi:hypothetical protein TL16_g01205 [Triparma laevis f. inornata]|uniref:Uncharacterized protein n=1 Tax=Triparma laevis f. inornata TaxID=1714386 RepID=A0A9W6ZGS2_9STRA|nr:hypothetical protein TL16_g01205 [Triparma laevis f. inornata]
MYSPALLTVCLIFFLFAIYITPFSNKSLNSNSTESDAENDNDSNNDNDDDDDDDEDGEDNEDYEVDANLFVDNLIMFKFPFIQQLTTSGVFIVTTLSLFVYATQTQFADVTE